MAHWYLCHLTCLPLSCAHPIARAGLDIRDSSFTSGCFMRQFGNSYSWKLLSQLIIWNNTTLNLAHSGWWKPIAKYSEIFLSGCQVFERWKYVQWTYLYPRNWGTYLYYRNWEIPHSRVSGGLLRTGLLAQLEMSILFLSFSSSARQKTLKVEYWQIFMCRKQILSQEQRRCHHFTSYSLFQRTAHHIRVYGGKTSLPGSVHLSLECS